MFYALRALSAFYDEKGATYMMIRALLLTLDAIAACWLRASVYFARHIISRYAIAYGLRLVTLSELAATRRAMPRAR